MPTRLKIIICNLLLSVLLVSAPALGAQNQERVYNLNIPQLKVDAALNALAEQTGTQLLFPYDLVKTLDANPVSGSYRLKDALEIILKGTGLSSSLTDGGVITISLDSSIGKNGELTMNRKRKLSLFASIVALFTSGLSVTDAVSEEASADSAKPKFIEEIIVTAEKREQDIQDVPASISAYSGDMLEVRGITTPQDLQFSVPGLSLTEFSGGSVRTTIRGIGNENAFAGGDPGVPIHINGHYTQSQAYMLRDMLDIERVEIQRGPQGTLYGRNAVGGNINIITKRPANEFEGEVTVDLGNYNKRQIQAIISGPFTDAIRGRLAVSKDKRDGYVENIGSGGDDRDSSDYLNARGTLEFDVTEAVQVTVGAFYFDDQGTNAERYLSEYPSVSPFLSGPNYWVLSGAGSNIAVVDPFKVRENTANEQINESKGGSIDISWDLGAMEFRSLTAYDDTQRVGIRDQDGSDVVFNELSFDVGFETFTQEFQLVSTGNDRLSWVAGLFFYDETSHYHFDSFRGAVSDNNGDMLVNGDDARRWVTFDQDIQATSIAAYGQAEFSVTEALELIAGLRYTEDEKEMDHAGIGLGLEGPVDPPIICCAFINNDTWDEVTWKLGVNYHFSEDVMAYASYSRGYKSGGFNAGQSAPYDPEIVDAYEVGLKSQWSDRVQLNLSAFYYDYQDKQDFQRIVTPTFSIFHIRNASAATAYGVEVEGQAYVTDSLAVDFSLGYQSAEFDDFITLDGIQPALGNQDLSGNQLPFAPNWKVHLGIQYDWSLDESGTLTARADYSWVDDQYSNAFNRENDGGTVLVSTADLIPSYHISNARLQWESASANWLGELYVKNITDEEILTSTFLGADVPGVGDVRGFLLAPRTYGLKVTYRF